MTARDLAATVRKMCERLEKPVKRGGYRISQEEAAAVVALALRAAEPCAECGHIDWREDLDPVRVPMFPDAAEWKARTVRLEEELQQAEEARDHNGDRGDRFKAIAKRLDGYEKEQRARAVRAEEALREALNVAVWLSRLPCLRETAAWREWEDTMWSKLDKALAAEAALAAAGADKETCPDGNTACDGSILLHGDWCKRESAGEEEFRVRNLVKQLQECQIAFDDSCRETDKFEARAERAEALLIAHHAVGALDGSLIGDDCPICTKMLKEAP